MPDARIANVIEQTLDFAVGENVIDDIVGQPIVPWMAQAHSVVPPWWSFARDAFMRDFWKRSSHLSTLMYTAQTLLANTPMTVEAKDPNISSHVEQAEMYSEFLWKASEFGESLFASKARFAEDYLAQDNGGFMEVLGDGRADGPIVGPPLAVRHLDAAYCWRTRNPKYPVVYHDPNDGGKAYKLHTSRVIAMSQMSSTEVLMNGVGYSAVSRSLQFAQNLYDIYIYKQEKLGSRPISKILVGAGFRGSHIMQAVKAANEVMSNQNLSRYSKIVGIGSDDVSASLNTVDLNDFDPFDEEISILFAMYGLAGAFGVPIQEVWPTSGGKGGRSGDMQESRQRGKLPAEFNAQLTLQLSRKYLPPHLRVVADWRDDYQDERRAVNQDIRARNRERDLKNASASIRISREQMLNDGDITRGMFTAMELEDGRLVNGVTVASLFYIKDKPYSELLKIDGVDNPTAVKANDKEEVLEKLDEQKAKVHEAMAGTTSSRDIKKFQQCLSALNWLSEDYNINGINPLPMELAIAAGVPERGDPNMLPLNAGAGRPRAGQEAGAEGKPPLPAGKPAKPEKPDKKPGRTPDESREGTVGEKKEKQVNASNFLEFLITMESELVTEFGKGVPSKEVIKEIVYGWLLFAYLEGIGKSEDELSPGQWMDITDQQETFLDQLDTIMGRKASGNDMHATISRLAAQVSSLFWVAFTKSADTGEKYRWIVGPTKESCADCQGFSGQVKTKLEWAKTGKLPQSLALECTGRNCLCHLSKESD